jgi:hypothetical protein
VSIENALEALRQYERLHDEGRDRSRLYREMLADAPWRECECAVCSEAGIEVAIFRGTERNKRRGFHNLHVFGERLHRQIATATTATPIGVP